VVDRGAAPRSRSRPTIAGSSSTWLI
jgi:hypothetical protein